MRKTAVLILAVISLSSALAFASAPGRGAVNPREKEILESFLRRKNAEAKEPRKAYIAARLGGGSSDGGGYDKFVAYNNSLVFRTDGGTTALLPLSESRELSAEVGMVSAHGISVNAGFEYWLSNGSNQFGDYSFNVPPIGQQNDFALTSEIVVTGYTAGADLFVLNPPRSGKGKSGVSLSLGGDIGYYQSRWKVWSGAGTVNLSTSQVEDIGGPLRDNSLGLSASLRAHYPAPALGVVFGLEASYLQLNFDNVRWYNQAGQPLALSYSPSSSDEVSLDFSGPRGRLEIRRYFSF